MNDDQKPSTRNTVAKGPVEIVLGLLPLLSLFGVTIKGLFPSIPLSETVVGGILAMGVLASIVAGRMAFTRLNAPTPQPIPFPENFWRLIFNRVPTHAGISYQAGARVRVVVVCDASSLATAEEIENHHLHPTLDVKIAQIDTTDISPEKSLPPILDDADAVYFFWTKEIRANSRIGAALNSWALVETDKPVLIINTIPDEPYELKFNTVPLSEAVAGLWRLLLRANERARLWIQQSDEYRRWWAWSASVAILLIALLGVWIKRTTADLKQTTADLNASLRREQVDENDFRALSEAFTTVRRNFEKTQLSSNKILLTTALNQLAEFVVDEIDRNSGANSDSKSQISIFRATNNKHLDQLAWSGNRIPRSFSPDRSSIVGCAVVQKAFVLWSASCASGTPAAWDMEGNAVGYCQGQNEIHFPSDKAVCSYKSLPGDRTRNALLCFSPEVNDPAAADTAVCLDTLHGPAFANEPWVKAKLEMLALVASSIPTNGWVQEKTQVVSKKTVKTQTE